MPDPAPSIGPTTARAVVLAAALGAGASWVLLEALQYAGISLPPLGPGAWVPELLLAALTGWLAFTTLRTVSRDRPLDADVAVIRLRLAKAGTLVAAALGAGYTVTVAVAVAAWPAPLARGRVLHAALAVVACVAWAATGLALERSCRIPPDPDEPRRARPGKVS